LIISISSFCELIGIYYGVLFGSPYRYSDLLGFKILDIPLLAVGGWLIIIYSSFTMTNLIFDKQHALLAVVDAIIATSLDLVIDPVMIGVGAWVWLGKGEYFGVPWANYGGWFIIVFSTCFIFRMYMFRKKINTAIDESNFKTKLERIWLVSPIATYLFLFIGYAHLAYMQNMIDIILIGLLSSQTIVFLALFRFYEKYWK
jgi:putative membrane protein